MERSHTATDRNDIRTEADEILRSGLLSILDRHGAVHMVGSYVLGLMKPHRMHLRDESAVGTPGLPRGFYWGVYLGDERSGAWKIDILADASAGVRVGAPLR
jgi:hypothetical protein